MALGPGPAGLKFWKAPGLSADNTADTGSLPASVGDQFNPWGPRRPVQDWAWGNLCLYPPPAGAPASIAYQTAASQSGGGPYSIALTVASAAGQERLVALLGIAQDITPVTFTSVTVDGQTATQVGSYLKAPDLNADHGAIVSFWRAAGTANISINVTFTASGGVMFDSRCAVWTLSNAGTLLDNGSAFYSNFITGDLALDLDTAASGVVAAAILVYSAGTPATTWTGLTERYDGGSLYGGDWYSVADLNVSSASTPLTVLADIPVIAGGNNAAVGLALSFNPAVAPSGTTFAADAGSYALTGSAAASAFRHVAGAGSYSLTGSSAGETFGFAAGAGSYSITGTAAGLTVAVNYAAAAGSYTIAGSSATFAFGHTAGAGSYVLTGSAASFVIPGVVDYLPAGMTGSYVPWGRSYPTALLTRTGRPLSEAAPVTLTAAGGSYTITGSAAALTVASPPDTTNLPASATSWFNPWRRPYPTSLLTRTGRPLAVGPLTLTAGAGNYTITGSSAALALRLTANSGSYTVSGSAAVLARGFAAGAGAYAILGTDAQLTVAGSITLACGAGSYTITGSDVSFIGVTPPVEVTPPPVGGTPAGFRVGRYRQFKLKKKRKHDQCEELLEYLRSLPPAEAEAAVAELPSRYLSLLDGLPLPHALVLPPHPSRNPQDDEDDDDACALLLEMLLR